MPRIAALTNGSPHFWIVLNAIAERFGPIAVLVENAEPKLQLIRRRMKHQGVVTVAGQIGFVLLQKIIARQSWPRILRIVDELRLDPEPTSCAAIVPVGSVNSETCRQELARIAPDVVVVFGTRIIGRETLRAINVPIINFHSGINPAYRGQAGGYWALAMGDQARAGVTAHLVDEGVDTGDVLYQGTFTPGPRDNFTTYFWLQAAAIRPLAVQAVDDALSGKLRPTKPDMESAQWYHPTLWFYVWTGMTKGVW
jgi:methionyl-tRNA formyltransferase